MPSWWVDLDKTLDSLARAERRRRGSGLAEELVGAAVFLSSEAASFVTGHILTVDGGFLASGVNQ